MSQPYIPRRRKPSLVVPITIIIAMCSLIYGVFLLVINRTSAPVANRTSEKTAPPTGKQEKTQEKALDQIKPAASIPKKSVDPVSKKFEDEWKDAVEKSASMEKNVVEVTNIIVSELPAKDHGWVLAMMREVESSPADHSIGRALNRINAAFGEKVSTDFLIWATKCSRSVALNDPDFLTLPDCGCVILASHEGRRHLQVFEPAFTVSFPI